MMTSGTTRSCRRLQIILTAMTMLENANAALTWNYEIRSSDTSHVCCQKCQQIKGNTYDFCLYYHRKQFFYTPDDPNVYVDWTIQWKYNPTTGLGTTSCRFCPEGWYRDDYLCTCKKCNSERCNTGEYAVGYYVQRCNDLSDRVCLPCGTCGIGTYELYPCRSPNDLFNTDCRACPPGKYRSNTGQSGCQTCTVCSTAQRQKNTPCTATENNRCTACASGDIVTGAGLDTCTRCGTGKYADNANNVCADCQTCARTHKQTGGCTPEANRLCEACPLNSNRVTTVTNAVHCAACKEGYYNTEASTNSNEPACAVCATSTCAAGTYVSCTNSDQMGFRQCLWCQGHSHADSTKCAPHRGVPKACFGTSTENVQCANCPAGTERPEGTDMVSVSLGSSSVQIQQCMACGTGKYKLTASNTACIDCANKPDNSQYVSWGTNPATSTACPWQCNAGYLRSANSCVACPTGQYSNTAGAASCQACTNAPPGTYYLKRRATLPTSPECPWECNAGSVRVGSTCMSCESGTTFRDATRNVQNEGDTNVCYPCSECTQQQATSNSNGEADFGLSGTYMTQECLPASDRVCALCSTSCGPGRRITGWCTKTQDLQCTACTTTCDPGEYLSSERCDGDTTTDTVRERCLECVASCLRGFYLKGTCPGNTRVSNECVRCDSNKPCDNKYRAGCNGTEDTFCQDFPVCDNGFYLSDESADQAGTCRPCSDCGSQSVVRPCTRFDDTVCRGTSSCSEGLPCSLLSASNRSSLFCDYSLGPTRAFCGVCPPGYRSDGQYCVECPRGYTCDLAGRLACRGQCPPWVRSECVQDFGLGFARCPAASCSQASNFGETRVAWRGSFELASEDNCATYFLCRPGHYKNFSAGGTVSCDGCDEALLPVGARWTTEGLSPEDDESCLWECQAETHAPSEDGLGCVAKEGRDGQGTVGNLAGYWRGVSSGGVCGLGRTSQAGAAVSPGECLACEPLVPDVMRWRDKTDQCEFECLDPTDTRRGSRCVPERLGCDEEVGLVRGADGVCAAQAYPWNRPGRRKTGGVMVVASTQTIEPSGQAEAPYPRASSVGFGIKDRHSVTPRAGAAALPVQGPLCSATTGVVGGREYVFGAVCNQSFLVYLDLSQPGAGLRVLIGDGERGWRDGFKTQARFESELYVAGEGQGTLFVLDTWNCVLREVVVWDRPGSYLTRVFTLWGDTGKLGLAEGAEAKCYGPGSLAWPRRFWPLLGAGIAGWLAFADEDGLWQFHTGTRELLEVAKEAAVEFEADELEHVTLADPFTLRLLFRGGYEMLLEAAQEPCPDGRTSLAGGECTLECRWLDLSGRPARYVDAATGQCRACTRPACGVGEELVLCTPRADGVCRRCALWADPACAACPAGCTRCAVAGGTCTCTASAALVYSAAGTCDAGVLRPIPPCEAGWYLLAGAGYCAPCPPFTATLFPGATRAEQCKCVEGMARRGGECVGEDLYEFEPSCLGSEACSVPRDALIRTDGGPTCGWVCKPGHYRDTRAGFLDQCRPCLLPGADRTRGDDDEPWSCE